VLRFSTRVKKGIVGDVGIRSVVVVLMLEISEAVKEGCSFQGLWLFLR